MPTALPDLTEFKRLVWEIVRQIPAGKVATYGQIGAYIPLQPGISEQEYSAVRPRWVGYAMSESPADVPWQRVINSQGKISLKMVENPNRQRQMLEAEGICFDNQARVNLDVFGWEGPPVDWCHARGLIPPEPHYRQGSLLG